MKHILLLMMVVSITALFGCGKNEQRVATTATDTDTAVTAVGTTNNQKGDPQHHKNCEPNQVALQELGKGIQILYYQMEASKLCNSSSQLEDDHF